MTKVACRIILSAHVSVPFLWTSDFGLGYRTWILDLELGLSLDNSNDKIYLLDFIDILQMTFNIPLPVLDFGNSKLARHKHNI